MSVSALIAEASRLSEDERSEFLVGVVSQMSVLGLSNLVKAIESKFDVKASSSAPIGESRPPKQVQERLDEQTEKTDFTIFVKAIDQAKKIAVIKEIRGLTGLGLKEAKELVEKTPTAVKANVPKADAENARKALEAAGATVELR
jgi:large subunit ribosomal protein L7/L12